jgi:hypothetical protein
MTVLAGIGLNSWKKQRKAETIEKIMEAILQFQENIRYILACWSGSSPIHMNTPIISERVKEKEDYFLKLGIIQTKFEIYIKKGEDESFEEIIRIFEEIRMEAYSYIPLMEEIKKEEEKINKIQAECDDSKSEEKHYIDGRIKAKKQATQATRIKFAPEETAKIMKLSFETNCEPFLKRTREVTDYLVSICKEYLIKIGI